MLLCLLWQHFWHLEINICILYAQQNLFIYTPVWSERTAHHLGSHNLQSKLVDWTMLGRPAHSHFWRPYFELVSAKKEYIWRGWASWYSQMRDGLAMKACFYLKHMTRIMYWRHAFFWRETLFEQQCYWFAIVKIVAISFLKDKASEDSCCFEWIVQMLQTMDVALQTWTCRGWHVEGSIFWRQDHVNSIWCQ